MAIERADGGRSATPAPSPATSSATVDGVVFRPLRSGNALEDTVARLLQTVRLGVVAPGAALPSERELAVRFSVSRDTVREAIRELAGAGYLVTRRGRYGGTFVVDPPPHPEPESAESRGPGELDAELDDVLGLREILELGAARTVASRTLGPGERALLWSALHDSANAAPADYRRLDSRLHLTIGELADIPSLVPVMADNRTRLNELLDRFPLLPRNIEHSNAQHEAIVSAILAGRPDAAAEAMREHLAGSSALLRGFLG